MPRKAAAASIEAASTARSYLTGLQVWQLKHLAVNTGVSPGGTKASTADAILSGIITSRSRQHARRYKSVDMGVKNLAFTVIESAYAKSSSTGQQGSTFGGTASFTLRDWQRLDVLTGISTTAEPQSAQENDLADVEASTTSRNAYSPANLAPAAARLARRFAESDKPDLILIERQRFRSGSGSAVQEWTLRVNSLEAMLWSSLETMRVAADIPSAFPSTVEMNPARIAAYWNTRPQDWSLDEDELSEIVPTSASNPKLKNGDTVEAATKRGMEKTEKISLVRGWLENGALDVESHLQPLADSFMSPVRRTKGDGLMQVGKKDDLADCVVQGITFALWERNRRLLKTHLDHGR